MNFISKLLLLRLILKNTSNFEFQVFIPNNEDNINIDNYYFPFSWAYFIQCYHRLKNRKNHETLDIEKNPNACLYLFVVLNLFKNTYLEKENKFKYFKLSFVDEKEIDTNEFQFELFSKIFNESKSRSYDLSDF